MAKPKEKPKKKKSVPQPPTLGVHVQEGVNTTDVFGRR
jgi:hypothetical protein